MIDGQGRQNSSKADCLLRDQGSCLGRVGTEQGEEQGDRISMWGDTSGYVVLSWDASEQKSSPEVKVLVPSPML